MQAPPWAGEPSSNKLEPVLPVPSLVTYLISEVQGPYEVFEARNVEESGMAGFCCEVTVGNAKRSVNRNDRDRVHLWEEHGMARLFAGGGVIGEGDEFLLRSGDGGWMY